MAWSKELQARLDSCYLKDSEDILGMLVTLIMREKMTNLPFLLDMVKIVYN